MVTDCFSGPFSFNGVDVETYFLNATFELNENSAAACLYIILVVAL